MNYPVNIFIIYAREDAGYKNGLIAALSPLKNQGWVESWHDGNIQPGQVWDEQIRYNLDAADLVIPLLSNDFFDSQYIQRVEINRAFDRFKQGTCTIVPVIVRACAWETDPLLSRLQILPKDGIPVGSWTIADEAYKNVVAGIQKVIAGEKKETPVRYPPVFESRKEISRLSFWRRYRLPLSIGSVLLIVFTVFQSGFWKKERPETNQQVFLEIKSAPNIPKIDAFLKQHPDDVHVAEARQLLGKLQKDFYFQVQSANALYRGGEKEKAFEAFSKARDINPDAPEIAELQQKLTQ